MESSSKDKCPLIRFYITETLTSDLKTSIDGFIKIDSLGLISFNFRQLLNLVSDTYQFYAVAVTKGKVEGRIPITLKRLSD